MRHPSHRYPWSRFPSPRPPDGRGRTSQPGGLRYREVVIGASTRKGGDDVLEALAIETRSWLEVTGRNEIDLGPEEELEILLRASETDQADFWFDIDQEIHVAVVGLFASNDAAEYPNVRRSVLGGERPELLAMCPESRPDRSRKRRSGPYPHIGDAGIAE